MSRFSPYRPDCWLITLIAWGLLMPGCIDRKGEGGENLPTRGRVSFWADESAAPLAAAEVAAFEALYPEAHLEVEYHPEVEVLNALLSGKTSLALLSRKLSAAEEEVLGQQVRSLLIAYDALAVIAHPSYGAETFPLEQLAVLAADSTRADTLVFVSSGSGLLRLLQDSLLQGRPVTPPSFETGSAPALIDYIARHPGCLGFAGLAWLSDREDPEVQQRLRQVKILRVSTDETAECCLPLPGHLSEGRYPLRRALYLIRRESGIGLASGFSAFAAGEQGQRIVLKLGLLPATLPGREVNVVAPY